MMQRSIGGEQLQAFEGLVHTTARMFAAQVRREEEDLEQELRVRVWRAIETYNTSRAKGSLERYVFMAVTNKVKDYKRDAARRAAHDVTIVHIEDMRLPAAPSLTEWLSTPRQEAFDGRFNHVERDEVFSRIDEGLFVLPSSVTKREADVLLLLMMDLSRAEVAVRLDMVKDEVEAVVVVLREKFADWRPTQRTNSSQTVSLSELPIAA